MNLVARGEEDLTKSERSESRMTVFTQEDVQIVQTDKSSDDFSVWCEFKTAFRRLVSARRPSRAKKIVFPDGQIDGQIRTTSTSKIVSVPFSH